MESFTDSFSPDSIVPGEEKYRSGYEVDVIDITEANISKYRNTYNSTAFRKEGDY